MPAPAAATAYSQIGQIASVRRVHEAFQWLHLHEPQIMAWQVALVGIAAPPFAEQARAGWLLERFRELGLADVHLDEAGNVLATLRGVPPAPPGATSRDRLSVKQRGGSFADPTQPGFVDPTQPEAGLPLILLSAHIDTVFPAETRLDPVLEGTRLSAPGACDNGAGVAALLAMAAALTHCGLEPGCDVLLAGNVGEEGEGNLRGMRHIYEHASWRGRIAAHLVLDGAGHEVAVTGALGSARFEVALKGAGGHSWTDAGRPNPIAALSEAIATMNRFSRDEPGANHGPNYAGLSEPSAPPRRVINPDKVIHPGEVVHIGREPALTPRAQPAARSTWNVGTIEGGCSVNAIPEQARARFDLRSTEPEQLLQMELALRRAVEDAVFAANESAQEERHPLSFTMEAIGRRPAATLRESARILHLIRGVDRHLNLRTECRTASTDANIPLSLGVEAISIGAGGEGGGIHTRAEWYDSRGRDLGLRRILLLLLALAAESADLAPDKRIP